MLKQLIRLNTLEYPCNLYHYTKCKGILGILSDKCLWATKSDFLNDANEIRYTSVLVEEVLGEIKNPVWRQILYQVLIPGLDYVNGLEYEKDYYVVSFSHKEDSITLWAEFGDHTGYNICFRSEELISRISREYKIAYHGKVVYNREYQKARIRKLLFYEIPEYLGSSMGDILEEGIDSVIFKKLCRLFWKSVQIYAIFFKQEEFAEEHEYRFAFRDSEENPVLYREKEGFLLPYMKIRIGKKNELLPIQSIMVAPKNHIDLARKGMEQYLKEAGYRDIPVNLSKIKLRY
ncbi:MAG: DUF2971 domain-containing protein [Lachnospiraceae bacterium]|nr:DUF2971 domain-containing protein [Lachnospiraceae bacterium]